MIEEATPSLLQVVRPMLVNDEGWRTKVYLDTKGIRTIGVGFNLEQPGAREICQHVGADYDKLLTGEAQLTPEQVESILQHFIISTMEWLTAIFPNFKDFTVNRQAALIDFGFVGQGTFKQFHGMIDAIKQGLWAVAAGHLENSLYAKQVPKRAFRLAELMING